MDPSNEFASVVFIGGSKHGEVVCLSRPLRISVDVFVPPENEWFNVSPGNIRIKTETYNLEQIRLGDIFIPVYVKSTWLTKNILTAFAEIVCRSLKLESINHVGG